MSKGNFLRGASRRSLLQQFGAAAIGITFAGAASSCGRGGGGRVVNFYNWDTYIGETTLADFQDESGVRVEMSLFSTNDELFAKLRAGNPGYDVIVPSNEFVTRMSEAQLIVPLDREKIPNFANILPEFQDAAFDPGRVYSMPYTWLVLGIAYRKSKMAGKVPGGVPNSWRWLFESDAFSGKLALLSESADLIRLCAKYRGHSLNNIPDAVLTEIEQMLIRQKPHVKTFHEDNGQDLLLAGDVDIVLEYNGDIAQIMQEDPDVDFVVPTEGSLLNSDCLCIPTGAPNPDDAHAFINYLLDAEAGKKITETILYPTPNGAARALMGDDYRANPVIFPSSEVLATCEYGAFEGAERAQLYEEIITRVRAA